MVGVDVVICVSFDTIEESFKLTSSCSCKDFFTDTQMGLYLISDFNVSESDTHNMSIILIITTELCNSEMHLRERIGEGDIL